MIGTFVLTDTWTPTASGYQSTAGTTATVALIRRGKLYTAHVGDSGLVVGEKQTTESKSLHPIKGIMFTTDHKPETPAEKEVIVCAQLTRRYVDFLAAHTEKWWRCCTEGRRASCRVGEAKKASEDAFTK